MKKIFYNFFNSIFIIKLIMIVGLSIFLSRSFIFNKIDINYLENLYSHSQWSMPLSTRIMSDNRLYQVAGYRLIKGASAFSIAPEVPPIGKYLYGLGIYYFNNPYLISITLYLISILLFSLISFTLFSDKKLAKISILIFSLSPIFVSQISQTMMELPQLFFLLSHVLVVLFLNKTKTQTKYFSLLLFSGISLGLFAASKIPIFVPLIIFVDFLYFKKPKKIISSVLLVLITGATYFISYAPTLIIQKMSILNWIKNQLWMINFYKLSPVENNPINYLSAIFLGKHKGWWTDSTWEYVQEWTILWPISALSTIKLFFTNFQKKYISDEIKYINNITVIFLLTWLLIPFWSRYFLLAIPFLVISLTKLLESKKKVLSSLVAISFIWLLFYLIPNSNSYLNAIEEKFNNSNYQDFYELIETNTSRDEFYSILRDIKLNTLSNNISIDFDRKYKTNIFTKETNLNVKIKYETPIGIYEQNCTMPIVKKQNQWKVIWNWECITTNFKPGDTLKTTISYAQQGTLKNSNKVILSSWGKANFILINARNIKHDDTELQPNLATIFKIKEAEVQKKIFIDYIGSTKIPLGFTPADSSEKIINNLKTNPAVFFENRPARVYNSELTTENLSLVKSIELKYPKLLGKNGGELVHINNSETIILINKEKIDGENITIEENLLVTINN